ncbi:MAG TPA: hypothetical protein VI759_07625, partial [Dehalococcoidia bacterium]|nr:hypothetical protein [Dehalococcoidia bacterium]
MTTPSDANPLAGAPGYASASRAGFLRALGQVGRVALLAGIIVIMVLLRSQPNLVIGLSMTAAAAGGLWLAIGREGGVRPLVIYLIGFGLFAQLRAFADQTGVPVRFDYVVDMEASVFGRLPSVWLQDQLYRPGSINPIDAASAGVYMSYFVAPHIVALIIWQRARDRF